MTFPQYPPRSQPSFPQELAPWIFPFDGWEHPKEVVWSEVFGNDNPVELEIGSGKGLFLAKAGQERPDHNFLGIELALKFARKGIERIARKKLNNVKMLPGDARRFLNRHAPSQSVAAVHIYFPDPWWKKRHKKRRVFCEEFVLDTARVLQMGGEFLIATDVEEYFGVMQDLMASRPEFAPLPPVEVRQPQDNQDYLTNFERKYRIEGRPIYRSGYSKIAEPPPPTPWSESSDEQELDPDSDSDSD